MRATGHTKDSIHIDASMDKVWEFPDDPRNCPAFITGLSGPDKIIGDKEVGMQAEWTSLLAGMHLQVTSRVAEHSCGPDGAAHLRGDSCVSSFAGGPQQTGRCRRWDCSKQGGAGCHTYRVKGGALD
jgi:hypothetical protein